MSPTKVTAAHIRAMKARGEKIAALTAYDFPLARLLDQPERTMLLGHYTLEERQMISEQHQRIGIGDLRLLAKPGAKQTGVGGALCVPIRQGDTIVGTIGVGTKREYEYTPAETERLEEVGRMIGDLVS